MLCEQDLVEALTQKDFWIGATGYLSDTPDRLVEPDGRCGAAAQIRPPVQQRHQQHDAPVQEHASHGR